MTRSEAMLTNAFREWGKKIDRIFKAMPKLGTERDKKSTRQKEEPGT